MKIFILNYKSFFIYFQLSHCYDIISFETQKVCDVTVDIEVEEDYEKGTETGLKEAGVTKSAT